VPLKNGLIQDLLREDERKRIPPRLPTPRYLDLELLDPVAGVDENDAFPPTMKPANRSRHPHFIGRSNRRSRIWIAPPEHCKPHK
jgi:hypothetical protein